ncbi:hypothetical protein PV08_10432 [Exophiala spinifera]|uniref:J domain-containing protein n=1 Tax=Exophiala spinifera TaxID=91928 RepID=A0A0D1ZDR1_9EURO|nr:uncharacterized protein PV08_10432 [Exophiala spinifera]KIW11132.1 hypothetical protein PV08_10432 [Exophiala spinifera]
MNTHYSVLGVAQTADLATIKASFQKLALKTHPDKGGQTEDFVRIHRAYEVLSDPAARAAYDQELQGQSRHPLFPHPPHPHPHPPPPRPAATRSAFTTPPPRPAPNDFSAEPNAEARYAFHRTHTNTNDNTGSPQRARRQQQGSFGRERQEPNMEGTGASRRPLPLEQRVATQVRTGEDLINRLRELAENHVREDMWEHLILFQQQLLSNSHQLRYRRMALTVQASGSGGRRTPIYGVLEPWDMQQMMNLRRALDDMDEALVRFEAVTKDTIATALLLRNLQTTPGAMGIDPARVSARLDRALDNMKTFLQEVLFQRRLWFGQLNLRDTFVRLGGNN